LSTSTGDFIPSPGFVGAKAGYSFKAGPKGNGYYKEDEVNPTSTHRARMPQTTTPPRCA